MNLQWALALKSENTRRAYGSVWAQWQRYLADIKALDASPLDAAKFIAELKANGKSDNTIHHRVTVLCSLYETGIDFEVCHKNPFRAVKKVFPTRRKTQVRPTQLLDAETVRRVVEIPDARTKTGVRDRAILALLFGSGIRRSELISLRVESLMISASGTPYLVCDCTKSGKRQERTISFWAWEFLTPLLTQRNGENSGGNDALFVNYSSKGVPGRVISESTLYRLFRRFSSLAGKEAAPHAARATFATRCKELGYEDREVATALGHHTESQVRVYDKRLQGVETSPAKKIFY